VGKHETKKIGYNLLQSSEPPEAVPAYHRRGPGSIRGSFVCELWWLEWHWDDVFSEHFALRLSLILPMRHTLQYKPTN